MADLNTTFHENNVTVNTSQWELTINDTQANRKVLMVFLRSLQNPETKKHLFTFKRIADAFQYPDRRNANNYWREFESCDRDITDYILRKRKVDLAVIEAVESELKGNIQASVPELCAGTNERLNRSDLTPANIRTALEQIPCTAIRREVRFKWESGVFHPKEKVILEEAMDALQNGSPKKKRSTLKLLSDLKIEANEPDEEKVASINQREAAEKLLDINASPDDIPENIRHMVVAMTFYFWNVPLARIAIWFSGKSKSTIWRWVTGLSVALWPLIKEMVAARTNATTVFIDEKWIKIKGRWYYWFVALDAGTGLPIMDHLLHHQTKWACRWFLLKMKRYGICPNTIMTDGLAGYASAISYVFAQAKHLLCIFHHQQGVTKWVKKNLVNLEQKDQMTLKKRMKSITQTKDTRTAIRRLERLEEDNLEKKWGIELWLASIKKTLKRLLPGMRSNTYPNTNNAVERFFKQFERFYKTRKGFTSVESAKQQLMVFMVMYFFTIQATSGQAPIETIIPEVKRMPLYQILNDPVRWMPRQQPTNLSRKAAEGPETMGMAEIKGKKAS